MITKWLDRSAAMVALITALGLATPGVSLAQSGGNSGAGNQAAMAGTRSNNTLAPSNSWQRLGAGEQRWYSFRTGGEDSNGNPAAVFIQMKANPQNGASFKIWSEQNLRDMATATSDNPVQPVGQGTQQFTEDANGDRNFLSGGDLTWKGGFTAGGTFLVQVQHTGAQPAEFFLTITGDSVSFPGQAEQPSRLPVTGASASGQAAGNQANQAATSQSAQTAGNQANNAMGSGMSTAMTASGRTMTINPGQTQWYVIQFGGESNPQLHPNIVAKLSTPQSGGVGFDVWTSQGLRDQQFATASNPVFPVGRGTTMTGLDDSGNNVTRYNGDLFWVGDARIGGTYYFVVRANGNQPQQYQLTVEQR